MMHHRGDGSGGYGDGHVYPFGREGEDGGCAACGCPWRLTAFQDRSFSLSGPSSKKNCGVLADHMTETEWD